MPHEGTVRTGRKPRCDGAIRPAGGVCVSRRQFCGTALAALAAGQVVRAAPASPGTKKKVVVAAHPWVYAATQPGHDITPILEGIFADMRYAGMEAIELMHTALRPDDAVKRIRALSEKHQLPVLGASFGGAMWDRSRRAEAWDDARLIVPRLAKLGGRTLGVSVGKAPEKKTPDQLDAQAELLGKIIALCEDHGVVLNLHNHTYEVENDLHDLKGTLERIPGVRLGPDLDWLVQAGVDPAAFIRRYGDRIVFLHLRDQQADKTWTEALGEGVMDWKGIAAALGEIGFAGDAGIELAHPKGFQLSRPLRESLRISREHVRKALGY